MNSSTVKYFDNFVLKNIRAFSLLLNPNYHHEANTASRFNKQIVNVGAPLWRGSYHCLFKGVVILDLAWCDVHALFFIIILKHL